MLTNLLTVLGHKTLETINNDHNMNKCRFEQKQLFQFPQQKFSA